MTPAAESSVSIVDGVFGGFFLPKGDLMERQTLRYGAHTRPEVAMLLSMVHPGDVILDIGAHVGTVAVPLARTTGPNGRLIAFEPDPDSRSYLELNIALNMVSNWTQVYPLAVGAGPGWVDVLAPDALNSGANYAIPTDDSRNAVRMVAIDDLALGDVDLMKIDVEGMEAAVLQGATQVIHRCTPVIYLEVSATQLERAGSTVEVLESFLSGAGYRFYRNESARNASAGDFHIVPLEHLPSEGLADVLCVSSESARSPV